MLCARLYSQQQSTLRWAPTWCSHNILADLLEGNAVAGEWRYRAVKGGGGSGLEYSNVSDNDVSDRPEFDSLI